MTNLLTSRAHADPFATLRVGMVMESTDNARQTTIVFVRHGETEANRLHRFQGWLDSPLSERGRRQAACLRTRVKDQAFDAVYASDLIRAADTARSLDVAAPLVLDRALREINLGALQGLSYADGQARYPEVCRALSDTPDKAAPPNGETGQDVIRRMHLWLTSALRRHRGERLLVVSHGFGLNVMLSTPLAAGARALPSTRYANASLTEVTFVGDRLTAWPLINDVRHLPRDLSSLSFEAPP